jgi:hypothetical protein
MTVGQRPGWRLSTSPSSRLRCFHRAMGGAVVCNFRSMAACCGLRPTTESSGPEDIACVQGQAFERRCTHRVFLEPPQSPAHPGR